MFPILVRLPSESNSLAFHFSHVEIGDFSLSIQASKFHYSSPRETLPNADDYETFELAIFFKQKWVNIQDFPLLEEFYPLFEHDSVAGYVERETIIKLVDILQTIADTQATEQLAIHMNSMRRMAGKDLD